MTQAVLTYDLHKKMLWLTMSILLTVICAELIAILNINSGMFVFTLDDPYIHLALAENILNGHYGVNSNEFSAASSSILWPFLITPFSHLSFSSYALLTINTLCALGTLAVFWRILLPAHSTNIEENVNANKLFTLCLIVLIPATNLVGLIFTGMEHSFQLLFATLIIFGLIHEIEHRTVPWWLVLAIIVSPLIRYECLALSLPALLFLFCRGYRTKSIAIGTTILILVGIFAAFLNSLGLDPFPTSIMAKSSVVSSGGRLESLLNNLTSNLTSSRGLFLVASMFSFIYFASNKSRKLEEKLLAMTISVSITLHLLAGRSGWYGRYEIYIWSATILVLLYLNKEKFYAIANKTAFYKLIIAAIGITFLLFGPYLNVLTSTPIASNNVYEQQYQMHRFATEYYNKPLAVNDLGYVSYHNNNYILDLWGLASIDALKYRTNGDNSNWIEKITKEKNIKFVMIYEDFFSDIPQDWQKIGELQLGKRQVTAQSPAVSFYVLDESVFDDIHHSITEFSRTLPEGVMFEFYEKEDTNQAKAAI